MNHNLNQLDFQTALAYDRLELNSSSFLKEERWAINTERSLLLQNNRHDTRKSFLARETLDTVKSILRKVNAREWTAPDIFSVEN